MKARLFSALLLLIALLATTACGGTLSVAFDVTETPDLVQKATLTALETRVATLEPGDQPLDLNSSSDEIRSALLHSHEPWRTLWVDGTVVWYPPEGGEAVTHHAQLWIERPTARFRSLVGPLEGAPVVLQVADGSNILDLSVPNLEEYFHEQPPYAQTTDWQAPEQLTDTITPYPLDTAIDSPLSEMIFATALAQRGGSFVPTAMEKVAGRAALLVEWSPGSPDDQRSERFWLDTRTGMPLRWQGFQKGSGENDQVKILSDIHVNQVAFDLTFAPELFSLDVQDMPLFALDASGDTGPTPIPPQTEFIPGAGELYVVIDRSPEPLDLVRLPGNCVTGSDPCPEPVHVEGFPNVNNTIEPLVWSRDGSQAVLVHQGELIRYNPASGEWTALAAFPYVMAPAWSPDGLWIAFVAQIEDDVRDVYVIRADGSDLQNMTNGAFLGSETFLWVGGWLSDGRVLIQVMDRMTNQLYAQAVGESQAQPLDHTPFVGVMTVSPDGQMMVIGEQVDTTVSVSLLPGLGGEARRLITFQQAGMQQILWSPDGTWIAFLVSTGSGPENVVSTVYAIRSDGTDIRQLLQEPSIGRLTMTTDGRFLIAEGTNNGRLIVIPIEDGLSRTLEVPGVRLNQRLLGASYR